MIEIPAGSFMMGTDEAEIERLCKKYNIDWFKNESPQHLVTLPSFLMGKYPVTQAQWQAVASLSLPMIDRELKLNPSHFQGDNLPVETVSWDDAQEFCRRLSQYSGRDYRLPSEAQWEYACRSLKFEVGSRKEDEVIKEWNEKYHQPFHFGETITSKLINYNTKTKFSEEITGDYRGKTTPVGQFPPNSFGLYDMHGNIWEWCADNLHENYKDAPNDDHAWVNNSNKYILRGGSWYSYPEVCRSAVRLSFHCDNCDINIGFRVVCVVGKTS